MHALKSRPGTTPGTPTDRVDEPCTDAEGVAQVIWRTLAERLGHGKKVESTFTDTRARSAEDVAHFELIFGPTGRDVYRFAAW